MTRHTRTDPACVRHRPPSTRLARWWFERGRGRPCRRCFPEPSCPCVACSRLDELLVDLARDVDAGS